MAEGASLTRGVMQTSPARVREIAREAPKPAPETTAPADLAAASPPPPKRARRNWKRPLLFALLPLALVAGGYEYITGGQVLETDNAYIRADTEGVSTDVAGTVIAVDVQDNEAVQKGQELYRLKQDTFKIALNGATAQLETVRDQVLTSQESYKLALAQVAQAQSDLNFYQTQLGRQKNLLSTGAGTQTAFDTAQHDLESVQQRVTVAKAQAATTLAQLGGDAHQKVEENPFYLQAKSLVDNAQRDLNDTVVRAPFDGVVTNVDAIQVGSYLQASQQAFSLVSTKNIWIEAEPKETELTYLKPGETASVTVDAYPGVTWKGTVTSISPASGSSFSLLPAQNTTGNWVKVVQRVPLRVKLNDSEGKPPLRVGMSVTVGIETGHARGWPEFVTSWFSHDEKARV